MIIDSSALLSILLREKGAENLLAKITQTELAAVPSPAATETGIVLTYRMKQNATAFLLRFFQEAGIVIVPFTEVHWQRAVDAYARFGKGRHPAGLNFGDCMTYAVAALARQPLLCIGGDFPKTDLEMA